MSKQYWQQSVLDLFAFCLGIVLVTYGITRIKQLSSPEEPFPFVWSAILCGIFVAAYLTNLYWRRNIDGRGIRTLLYSSILGSLFFIGFVTVISLALGKGFDSGMSPSLWIFFLVVLFLSTTVPALLFRGAFAILTWLRRGFSNPDRKRKDERSGVGDRGFVSE